MAEQPIAISEIADPDLIRVQLLASGRGVHAPMKAFAAASVHGAPTKTTPVNADEFGYWDSVGLQAVKTTWANIKATLKTYFDTLYQPLASALTSWAAITRASGFDTFVATPTSANFAALLTDETGTGANVFAGAPTITGIPIFSGIPSLTGGALTFPATQVASAGANNLDDYEEGTFTPRIDGTTAAGAGTYTLQSGQYTKIGNAVTFSLDVAWTAHTGTGNMIIAGLPFTSSGPIAPVTLWYQNLTFTNVLSSRVSGTTILLETVSSGAAAVALPIDTAARIAAGGVFYV